MGKNRWRNTLRLFMGLIVLFLGYSLSLAQSNSNVSGGSNASSGSNGNSQQKQAGPPSGCKPGKMRCTKNDHRMAAATRNADRRATDQRKHQGKGK